ncbi:MAG: YlbF family regulator [Lactobacillales bacterium]|jgi:cell fate (sporulation/competence/biofilm development) regulator YlbF (YheA/YmcA/DUF963 family)|nr:YlbF family regulator [Lactobacillales bacterium]
MITALDLKDAIQSGQVYKDFKAAESATQDNEKLLILKNKFNVIQEKTTDPYLPDEKILELKKELLAVKKEYELDPAMQNYHLKKTELDNLLDEISERIAKTIDPEIKVDYNNILNRKGHDCHAH